MEFGQPQPHGLDQLSYLASLPRPSSSSSQRSATSTLSQDSIFSTASHASASPASSQGSASSESSICAQSRARVCLPPLASTANQPVAPEQRCNPRRSSGDIHKPPALVRQDERKVTFVDSLVDSATQMVEVIWPLSATPLCRPGANGVLSLRRYIEETLRRSRTSYSTLQVALYYLILIMPCVPKSDFTKEQFVDSPSTRALQCGRRMFLAALILASKYLQDRNYSAKAWSKMSGLKVAEINLNERAFLSSVGWKLHIPDHIFKRWTDIVLRYTPSQFPPPPANQRLQSTDAKSCWKSVIPLLTPSLDTIQIPQTQVKTAAQPVAVTTSFAELPSFLEPEPAVIPPVPAVTSFISSLPTPRPTPRHGFSTPAASVASLDSWVPASRPSNSRRPSLASSRTSSGSSPESMVSDSTRLSRASSVSSVSTFATVSSSSSCLAKLVRCRNAADALPSKAPEQAIIMEDDLVSSPLSSETDTVSGYMASVLPSTMNRPGWTLSEGKHMVPKFALERTEDESEIQKLVRASIWVSEEGNPLTQMVIEDDVPASLGCNLDKVRSALSPSVGSDCRKRTHRSLSCASDEAQKRQRMCRGRQSVAIY
ncbi:hypothetical protein MBLNU459_g6164t1 [Dothideomycetes sp. NU459]